MSAHWRRFLGVTLVCFGCDGPVGVDIAPDRDSAGPDGDDGFFAEELWSALQGYSAWDVPEGWSETPTESADHVGLFVVRYDNATLALWDGGGEAPGGSIALKEEFDADGVLLGFTAMQKRPGYDPDHGDWFWAKYDVDGTVRTSGQVAMCFTCHADAPSDYLHVEPPSGP